VVNLLRKRGGQFAPENNQKVTCSEVVNLSRNQVVNLSGFSSVCYILLKKRHFFGDEFAIDWHFHLPMGTIWIITAAIAVAVLLLIVFKFIPVKQRFTFITAGLAGGVTGYLFWLVWFGKLIMP